MLRIGLTGGIGSGKTTVADLLRSHGLPIIDADLIARDIVKPGQPALAELAQAFGHDILNEDGSLNRSLLATRAFVDSEHTELLNSITHPRIQAETARRFAAAEAAGEKAVVYDMPLLVDNGLHEAMDLVVVVDVDAETRVARLVAWRGLTEEDARRRLDAQISDEVRLAPADVVIDNNGNLESLDRQVADLIERIRGLEVT
ncbi:dephospho-CoA kinase [Corynebacterium testudinoris]|uniref:Dephospho-CoA kinase n=1 Tax=Corynebacterium testudinoris TaxID=136857 RepID=A0A0G3H7D3_9CORY|nr:dephospho-CoA kinase [Corynebacterium testudinoris]AKK08645.1 dephospho-CoA kinase [Corynebacterium testudinoris]